MDDHHHRLKAYDRVRRGRILGACGVGGLVLVVGLLGFQASQNWDARFERVIEPLPGLHYAPPTQDVSLTTEDNPIPLAIGPYPFGVSTSWRSLSSMRGAKMT